MSFRLGSQSHTCRLLRDSMIYVDHNDTYASVCCTNAFMYSTLCSTWAYSLHCQCTFLLSEHCEVTPRHAHWLSFSASCPIYDRDSACGQFEDHDRAETGLLISVRALNLMCCRRAHPKNLRGATHTDYLLKRLRGQLRDFSG